MKRAAIAVLGAFGLSACSITAPALEPINLLSPYDPTEQAVRSGGNTISGNAVLRTVGGEVRTCAGLPVKLVNVNAYSTERISAVYGRTDRGFRGGSEMRPINPPNPHWQNDAGRTETCDSQGDFSFGGVADGEYYVVTAVVWGVPQSAYYTSRQGGGLFQRVSVSGGEVKRIVLTQN